LGEIETFTWSLQQPIAAYVSAEGKTGSIDFLPDSDNPGAIAWWIEKK
jgi:hypothetical protein